jgi:phosphotransferase system HPr-like phosphotransfer protein
MGTALELRAPGEDEQDAAAAITQVFSLEYKG